MDNERNIRNQVESQLIRLLDKWINQKRKIRMRPLLEDLRHQLIMGRDITRSQFNAIVPLLIHQKGIEQLVDLKTPLEKYFEPIINQYY
jgi:hypothetical protein